MKYQYTPGADVAGGFLKFSFKADTSLVCYPKIATAEKRNRTQARYLFLKIDLYMVPHTFD
jgi:hypothetical protein